MKVMLETTGEREVADLMLQARKNAAAVNRHSTNEFNHGYVLGRLLIAKYHLPWPDSDTCDIAFMSAQNEIGFLFYRARERAHERRAAS